MKPTQEEIDQLLSGYLDDALDATELKQVKDWLNHDAEIISRHRELVDMRRTMKELFKVAPSKQLADSFSMQVLSAAVTRAHEEAVDESHPLMRVQEQPFTHLNTIPAQVSTRRLMMVTLTLAASLFGLIFGMDFLDRQEIIQQPLVSQNALPVDVIAPPADLANDQNVGGFPPNPTSTSDAVENSLLASGERSETKSALEGRQVLEGESPRQRIPLAVQDASSSRSLAESGESMKDSSADAVASTSASPRGAVLVLKISQSETGRTEQAVRRAMSASGFRGSNEISLSREALDQLVAKSNTSDHVGSADPQDLAETSVLLLTLSAKRFDQFYQAVWSDERGIESLAMSVAFDAPIVELVDSIGRDPTSVKHEVTSLRVDGVTEKGLLVGQLKQIPTIPMDRSASDTPPGFGLGDDLQTQVLLIVR